MAKAGIDTIVCIKLTAQEQLSHLRQRENGSLLTLPCLQQVGLVRAPLLGFTISLSKILPKILGMSYCIIAVNAYDMFVSTRLINHIVTVRSLEEI